jgi:hypothetical protein
MKKYVRPLAQLCLAACLVSLLPARASAWGGAGHRVVAKIAKWRLEQLRDRAQDPRAARALKRINQIFAAHANILLAPGNIESAAVWPDSVRTKNPYKFSKNLHFVSIPLNKQPGPDRFVPAEQCRPNIEDDPVVTGGDCSVAALAHFREVLRTSQDSARLLEALSFVIHFLGDLHQPLHNSEDKTFDNDANFNGGHGDRGGNLRYVFYLSPALFNGDEGSCRQQEKVCTTFYPSGPAIKNLHGVWDDEMISTEMAINPKRKTEEAYAQTLERALPQNPTAAAFAAMAAGDPAAWAEEAHDIAERNAYALPAPKDKIWPKDKQPKPPQPPRLRKFFLVDRAYRDKNIKNVDLQLQRAGVRLAAFLMDAFN